MSDLCPYVFVDTFSYFLFRDCLSCLKRYSCLRIHHVRGDLALALIAAYLYRVIKTMKVLIDESGSEYIEFHDGVGVNSKDRTKLGKSVFLLPGKAERRYSTTEADSPAR